MFQAKEKYNQDFIDGKESALKKSTKSMFLLLRYFGNKFYLKSG